jgi:serine protease
MAIVAGSVYLGASSTELVPAPGTRIVLPESGLPAIDRGLLAEDRAIDVGAPEWQRSITKSDGQPIGNYRPGRVIVKFRGGTSPGALAAVASGVNAASVTMPNYADFHVLEVGEDAETVAHRLSLLPDVEYAQAAYYWRPYLKPNDPFYSRQWNLSSVLDMERAWDINPGAKSSIVVAVVDSGVAYKDAVVRYSAGAFSVNGVPYPSLGAISVAFAAASDLGGADRFVAPYDFVWEDDTPFDFEGHGTHVSGTIGQLTNNNAGVAGMAFNARIMPVKVIAGAWDFIFRAPNQSTDDVVARGIRYAASNGAKVINMSIGRTGRPAPVIEDAMRFAIARGVFIAVAAGNGYENGNPPEVLAEIAGRLDGAVAVGAVGETKLRSYYSTTGSFVELCAPGGDRRVDATNGRILQQTFDGTQTETFLLPPSRFTAPRFDVFGYVGYQGTSMATPHVAGLAAMVAQQGITDPAAIEAALKQFATDLGTPGRDEEYGFGLINPRATLRGLGLSAP